MLLGDFLRLKSALCIEIRVWCFEVDYRMSQLYLC